MENHSKHPYVLAQYGWGGDLLGWGEYDGDTRFHVFTIYDSDKVLTKGSLPMPRIATLKKINPIEREANAPYKA